MNGITAPRAVVLAAIGIAHLTLVLELQLSTEGVDLSPMWLEVLRVARATGMTVGLTGSLMIIGHGLWGFEGRLRGLLLSAFALVAAAMVCLGAPMTMIVMRGGGTLAEVLPAALHWPVAVLAVAALDLAALGVLVLARGEGSMAVELKEANDQLADLSLQLGRAKKASAEARPAPVRRSKATRRRAPGQNTAFTEEQKAAAVARAGEIGIQAAALEVGVHRRSVQRWREQIGGGG